MWNKTSTVHRDTKEQFQQAHRCVRFCCLSPAHLWCAVLTATTLAQGNWIKSVSVQMKNYECAKGNPSGKNQFTEDSCYASSFTDTWQQVALGTGLGINQNSRRNPCDLREQLPKIPKCPWESTRSARVSEHQPHPKHILGLLTQGKRTFGATSTGPWRNTSSKPRKHPYTTQAVPQLGKSLEGTSGKGGAAAGLVPTAKMHQAQTTECVTGPLSTAGLKPRATRLEVSGMSQSIQTASCSWRHFVSWKNQDTGTVWVTWLGLGHEAIVKMGRKYNCKSTKCKKPAKVRQDLTWERFMPKVMFWKDSTEEGFFPSLWWSSTSEWKEQWQCPVSELCPRHQPMTRQATQIWSSQPLKQENWHDLSWFYWLSLWK